MVEVNKVRKVMDPHPLNRLVSAETFPDRLKNRSIIPDLGMAGHASFDGWNSGKGHFFHRHMAKTAVNANAVDVMFMAERNGLFPRNANHVHIRGTSNRHQQQE
jgi:hypothetical protein